MDDFISNTDFGDFKLNEDYFQVLEQFPQTQNVL